MAVVAFFGFRNGAPATGGYATMTVIEGGALAKKPHLVLNYPDGNVETVELKRVSTDIAVNMGTVTNQLNIMREKGYRLVATQSVWAEYGRIYVFEMD